MMHIQIHKGEWMDEVPDHAPLPELEHVYTFMLMEVGPPDLSWLLSVVGARGKILKIRDTFDLPYSSETLMLQFVNWYDQQKSRTP